MTDAGWFQDGQYIVESAWGRFQDTPIFRALARQHNVTVTEHQMIDAIADGGYTSTDKELHVKISEADWDLWPKGVWNMTGRGIL